MTHIDVFDRSGSDRPGPVTLLAALQIVGGASLIAIVAFGNRDVASTLGGSGFLSQRAIAIPVLYAVLGIVSGIGMWLGKPWGWWLAAFYYLYSVVDNAIAVLQIPVMVQAFGEPARGVGYYYLREVVQLGWSVPIMIYWFSRRVLAYFDLAELSRRKAILALSGGAVAIVAVAFVLPAGGNREFDRIVQIYEQGDVPAAVEGFAQYLESHPDDDLAWTILGHANLDMDAYPEAEAAYQQAIEINPERYEAWTGLGLLDRIRGDNEQAVDCYEKALEINPDDIDAHTGLAIVALQLHQDTQALGHAQRAYELDKLDPVIVANLAIVYHFNGMRVLRDSMTAEAERLGYDDIDGLKRIYTGEVTIRE